MRNIGDLITRFCLVWIACGFSLAQATTIQSDEAIVKLQSRVYSEPIEVAKHVEAFLKTANPASNLDLWTVALNMHLVLYQGDFDAPESEALQSKWIDQTLPLLSSAVDSVLKIDFLSQVLFRKVRKSGPELDLETTGKEFESLAQKAKSWGNPILAASIYSEYMFFLSSRQQSVKALTFAHQALNEIAADTKHESIVHKAEIQSNIAVFYLNEEKLDDALSLWLDIHQTMCLDRKNLYFCNPILTNIAGVYIQKNTPEDALRALAFLDQAFVDAKMIDDISTLAHAHYKRASIYVRQELWSKALQDYQAARKLYEKLDSPHWMIKILVGMARVQNKLGKFDEALVILKQAQSLVTPESKALHPDMDDALIETWRGLKQFEQALDLMSRRFKELQSEYQTKTAQTYNESMANVGLQIEQQKNKVLERDKEIVQLKLANSERFQKFLILGLAVSLLIVLASVWMIYQNRLIRQFKKELQRILDTIDEAIFTVGSHLTIHGPVSKFLATMIPDRPILVGNNIELILQGSLLHGDQIQVIKECLSAMLYEDRLAWELNMAHLPLELTYQVSSRTLVLSIHWQPLWNMHEKLEGVMVSMRDITDRRDIERVISQERVERKMASECLLELARTDLTRVRKLLNQTSSLLEDLQNSNDELEFRRVLHTVKGVARSIGLKVLSHAVHLLEDNFQSGGKDLNPMREVLRVYEEILVPFEQTGGGVRATPALELSGIWSRIIPNLVNRLQEESLEYFGSTLSDRVGQWPTLLLEQLEYCLLHAVNNSIDHGFSQSKTSSRAMPYFEIEAKIEGEKILVNFRDNGQGIDFDQLALVAAQRNMLWNSREDLLELIFAEGTSTAPKLTETSGRGVGMSAIRALCRSWGGDAHIKPRTSQTGTDLSLSFARERLQNVG